ncbi:MAG: ATP-binding protein [Clostridia bacterium]|nr:ATP-binding protein [Clostridia bacterium]
MKTEREYALYGLDPLEQIIIDVLEYLDDSIDFFDLQLILSESISNAFFHGNQGDVTKPIYLKVIIHESIITFKIKDAGACTQKFNIHEEIEEEDILSDRGRGLFLLKCFTDYMDYKNNTLILKKKINSINDKISLDN